MMQARQVLRVLLALDIERFGRRDRHDTHRLHLRAALRQLLSRALTEAGVAGSDQTTGTTGDGLWVLFGPDVETATVLQAMLDASVDETRIPTLLWGNPEMGYPWSQRS
jgi:hypothetical protein